jgi:hypothetical protein
MHTDKTLVEMTFIKTDMYVQMIMDNGFPVVPPHNIEDPLGLYRQLGKNYKSTNVD